jgi:protein subunit release factor A
MPIDVEGGGSEGATGTSPLDARVEARLREAVARFEAIELQLGDPSLARDPERIRSLGKERSGIEPVAQSLPNCSRWPTSGEAPSS